MATLRPYQPADENSVPGGIPIYRGGDLKAGAPGLNAQCTPQPQAGGARKGGGLGGMQKQGSVGPRRALGNITNVSSTPAKVAPGLGGATPAKGGGLGGATPAGQRRVLGGLAGKGAGGLGLPSASKGKQLRLYDEGAQGSVRQPEEAPVRCRAAVRPPELEVLAERYAQEGVEGLAGLGWREQERERRPPDVEELLPPALTAQLAEKLAAWEAQDRVHRDSVRAASETPAVENVPLELSIPEPAATRLPPQEDLTGDLRDFLPGPDASDASELQVLDDF